MLAHRIFEHECGVVPDLAHDGGRRCEVGLFFAVKANDDIGRNRDAGNRRAHSANQLEIFRNRVAAFHRAQDSVGSRLQRQMHMRLDLRLCRHRLDNRLAHVARMRRGEANPLDPVDRRNHPEQRAEVGFSESICVDGLSEQHHLFDAARGQLANLAHQVGRRNRALAPAHVRHDAERTELVASAHRRHVRAHAAAVVGGDIGIRLRAIESDIDGSVESRARDHLGQAAVAVWPRHDVEERRLLHNRDAIMLRHTSEQPKLDLRPRLLKARELPQPVQHLLFGVLANRAGVEQHDVRIVDTVGRDVTGAAQDCAHRLRIGDIHLTAVGLQVNPRMRRILVTRSFIRREKILGHGATSIQRGRARRVRHPTPASFGGGWRWIQRAA